MRYGRYRLRAMTNFVMGLASSPRASHPVEVSESPFNHYHYSNLTKVLSEWKVSDMDFRGLIAGLIPPPRLLSNGTAYYGVTHDATKMTKPHSPCLEGRQYVHVANNVIPSNRALGVGYPLSALHLGVGEQGWCPPLALERCGVDDDLNAMAVKQIESLMGDQALPFGAHLCLCRADSAYGKAIFLAPLYEMGNMVAIVRLRAGMKVWAKAPEAGPTGGAPRIYGDKFYLCDTSQNKTYKRQGVANQVWQQALCDRKADKHVVFNGTLDSGREVRIEIWRWNDLLIRTRDGASMKDKPMDVVRVQVFDAANGRLVFKRPMFIAVSGRRKEEVDIYEVHEQYRERYDVEPYYRYANNSLLMDRHQTSEADHLDPWLRMVQATTWLLFAASSELGRTDCPVWQKYLPKNKEAQADPTRRLTIAQAQKAAHLLFCTFDPTPFLPQNYKKGKGRIQGTVMPKKKRFKVEKKVKKTARKTLKQT